MAANKSIRKLKRKIAKWFTIVFLRILRVFPAKKALSFLFNIETWLYYIEGQIAIEYGGGVHPKHRLTGYHNFFIERINPGERVLDIGCGNGAVAFDVAESAGAFVTGIDMNPQNIKQAVKRYTHERVDYVIGDVLEALPDEPYDVIILSNVLEHLPDRSNFLRKTFEITGAKRILIRVPNIERNWRVPLKREIGVEWRLDPTHLTEHTEESLLNELDAAGLESVCKKLIWGEIWVESVPANNKHNV